ncbi:hypothetical protein EK904_003550 [Melospiza melodia maxima]|nr:hypothetical protein EK904_003550 [Melospiza melodia maxima]
MEWFLMGHPPSPAEILPYSSRGIVSSAALHSLHPLPRGTTRGPGSSPPALLAAAGMSKPKAECEQVLSGRLGQPWGHWGKLWKNSSLPQNLEQSLKGHSSISCSKTFFYKFDFQQLDSMFFLYPTCVCGVSGREARASEEEEQFWLLAG